MTTLRPAAVAGRFYPGDPVELRRTVREMLDAAADPPVDQQLKAIIVPHAGYPFSGPIAATAYRALERAKPDFQRVVLIGPAHYDPVPGVAISTADEFETPLGRIPVDTAAVEQLRSLPQVLVSDDAHRPEHCLEVQLPFLQVVLGEFSIVPLLAGRTSVAEVKEVLAPFWNDPQTLLVVSSDLSHYQDYDTARDVDSATAEVIQSGRINELRGERACGFLGIGGAVSLAAEHNVRPALLDLRNSGDTAGDKARVVGYSAFAIPVSAS